jgi:hypothetical protein
MVASKPAATRARRNRTSTRAVLKAVVNPTIPDLPDFIDWHRAVMAWWKNAWSSPMAPEWTDSDQDAMFLAARLMQQFWDDETRPAARVQSATEVRHILMQCGLTPMSRRSLQWEVEKVDEAQDRGDQRRAARKAPDKVAAKDDPRRAIRPA